MIKSIGLVRLSALGDALMTVPLVRTLQAAWPQATITWIIARPAFDVVAGLDGVEFIVIDKPKTLADYWRFKKRMRAFHFDVLLALQTTFRANLLYPCMKAHRKIGYAAHKRSDGHHWFVREQVPLQQEHTLERFLRFATYLGIKDHCLRWDMPVDEQDCAWARQQLPASGPVLVVNPAASKPERTWPAARYIALLQQVQSTWPVHIVLTGGPSAFDRQLADSIKHAIPNAIDLVGKTKPKQLLEVIRKACAVLCPDTGPSHMAVAVNTPVIALHAVTNPAISGPYTFQQLVVNSYPQAVETLLGVPYAQHVWGTHVHGHESMALVQVDAVMEKLRTVFG